MTDVTTSAPVAEGDNVHISTGLMVFCMVLWTSLGHKLASNVSFAGEGMAAALMGLLMGMLLLALRGVVLSEELTQKLLTFNHANFFTFFLPPIIFYAGLSVRKKAFFANFLTIGTMGILGTYIAFVVIACLLFAFSRISHFISLADCLALAAIFATTDSVAVLQVLEQERAPLLFSLVFGEGVINDATTVALMHTVEGLGETPTINFATVCLIFGKFSYLFIISLLMGVAFGLAGALLVKKCNASSTPQAVGMIGMVAYLSYLIGDYFKLSGIVSIFCCAVTMSHYALHNISKQQRAATVSAFETLSYLAEGSIFVYVGLDAFDPLKWANMYLGHAAILFVVVLFLLLFSRAVFTFPIMLLHNRFSKEKLKITEIVVIWWAGAMRGAVSVALVYYYYDPDGKTIDRQRSTLITMTLTIVLFSTMVFGGVTRPLLDFLLGKEEHPRGRGGHGEVEMTPGHGDTQYAVVNVHDQGYDTDGTCFSGSYYDEDDEDRAYNDTAGLLGAAAPLSSDDGALMEADDSNSLATDNPVHQAAELPMKVPKVDDQARLPLGRFLSPPRAGLPQQAGGSRSSSRDGSRPGSREQSPMRVRFAEGGARASGLARVSAGPLLGGLHDGQSSSGQSSPMRSQSAALPSLTIPGDQQHEGRITEWWASFDKHYMRPLFTNAQGDDWTPRGDNQPDSATLRSIRSAPGSPRRIGSFSAGASPVSTPFRGPRSASMTAISRPPAMQHQQTRMANTLFPNSPTSPPAL
ncbi:hypothetical protein WJX72_002484 [[Myrmecia] bisecta]|uniref:Cation/H+ exchanger transmembrane domain-containing protein n=1 Tax=[Myrmecia] bisecta TaxID=41462 RepID=A0AAW1QQP7_9CHLO